jgi:hypothetical protein
MMAIRRSPRALFPEIGAWRRRCVRLPNAEETLPFLIVAPLTGNSMASIRPIILRAKSSNPNRTIPGTVTFATHVAGRDVYTTRRPNS